MAETVPLLEMRTVTKSFPGVRALHNVSLSVKNGEIHALTGENGAGKSTLMKILSGAYAADSGAILMQGQPVKISNPNDAREYGIKIIYQELSLAANMTVAENIFLGMELAQGGVLVNRAGMNKEALKVLERLGASFGPGDVVGRLSIAEQQQVEIARAIIHDSKVLIMDEPTATLSEWETERLFQIIRVLRDDGIAVIYISHRMAEIYELADRVSVLRDGEYIGTLERSELSAPRLIQMMVGRELKDFYKHERTTRAGSAVLEVRGMSDGHQVRDVSFTVRSGEVLGLAGLVGAGRTELARLVFGADPKTKGDVILEGRSIAISRPTDAIRAGIGYLPENRKEQGLFLQMSAQENIAINVIAGELHCGDHPEALGRANRRRGNPEPRHPPGQPAFPGPWPFRRQPAKAPGSALACHPPEGPAPGRAHSRRGRWREKRDLPHHWRARGPGGRCRLHLQRAAGSRGHV